MLIYRGQTPLQRETEALWQWNYRTSYNYLTHIVTRYLFKLLSWKQPWSNLQKSTSRQTYRTTHLPPSVWTWNLSSPSFCEPGWAKWQNPHTPCPDPADSKHKYHSKYTTAPFIIELHHRRTEAHRNTPLESHRGQSVPRGCVDARTGWADSPETPERRAASSAEWAKTLHPV